MTDDIERCCTVCQLNRAVRVEAVFVATGVGGMQWFECANHGPTDHPFKNERVSIQAIEDWIARIDMED